MTTFTLQRRVLEERPVIRHFVADAVDDDAVRHRFVHARPADVHELGDHALVPLVDLFDERGRKRPLAPDKQSNLQRFCHSSRSRLDASLLFV
ncbi:MAG: hypothetical protein IPM16_15345 [Chloroflexi bacterium]|nr:hypothetical protein [Chloroflexota bacterium]